MVYRFTLLSDEVDDFLREIQIESTATFLDFNKAILESLSFSDKELTTFFTCSRSWEKEVEITRFEMDTNSEEDSFTMEDTPLDELIEDQKQRLIFIFDQLTDRCLFIELSEIITSKHLDKPVCTKSVGNAPKQTIDFDQESLLKGISTTGTNTGEDFYGDDGFNEDELDAEGFDIEGGSGDVSIDTIDDLY
ncbi:MAG: hypothetical protein MJY71_02820 [Bacteroidaceae bacterium]|nr:hypothetical protein [Bacteroidaceae bacterium]